VEAWEGGLHARRHDPERVSGRGPERRIAPAMHSRR
jgi:hypothetical protein